MEATYGLVDDVVVDEDDDGVTPSSANAGMGTATTTPSDDDVDATRRRRDDIAVDSAPSRRNRRLSPFDVFVAAMAVAVVTVCVVGDRGLARGDVRDVARVDDEERGVATPPMDGGEKPEVRSEDARREIAMDATSDFICMNLP